MPQPAGPQDADTFVGRSRELTALTAALRQAATGDARLALVAGEPGIGKTELARAFARAAGNDGVLVLWGSAWEDGGAPPYWPWVQVLRSYGRQAGAEALAEAAGPQAAVLGQLLPELGTAPAPAGPASGARFAFFEAVCAVLDRASRSAPLVVILDDLHAAGRSSALLLRFAAAARLSRVLLLGTYRTAEAAMDPDVSDVITALESVSPPLVLAGLSSDDIRLMLPGAGADVLAVVQRRGEGNPLFVSQVARLLGQGAATVEEVPVPAGIRQAVRRQVARLGDTASGDDTPAAGEVLATAAALGPGIDPAMVAAALAAAALATSLAARQHVLWGTQDPADALTAADDIVTAAQRGGEPETELDGRVLRLTHLLELGDGPAAQRVLPELGRLAGSLRQPAVQLVALSRRSTLAALTGDFAPAAEFARQAFQIGQAASLPDADAVYWGQLFAIWLHVGLPGGDEQWMERELRDLVARSHLSVAHAAALVQIEAAHGATEQARGRLDELVGTGLGTLRPNMVYVWALTELARGCVLLRAARHAPRIYRALAPYAGRAAVAAGAVMCSGSTDFYLAGLAALADDAATAERHYRAAVSCHRRLGARPMLAHTLHEYALLLRQRAAPGDLPAASAALAEALAIAADCGMTRLLAVLDQQDQSNQPDQLRSALTLNREDDFWLIGYADSRTRVPDSLGLRYLDLLVRNPGRELAAVDLVRLAAATGPAAPYHQPTACTMRPEPPPATSSTGKPGPPTGSAWPASTRNSPRPKSGTTPSGPAGSAPRKSSWSASSPPRPDSAAGRGSSARSPNEPGSTSPGPSGPRSPASATAPRTPPLTSTRPSGPEPAAPTPRRTGRAEHAGMRLPREPARSGADP